MANKIVDPQANHSVGGRSHNRLNFDPKPVVEAYLSGESELSISKRTGLKRIVIRRRLVEAGVAIRSISEANYIRMSKLSFKEKQALTKACNAASKDMPKEKRHQILLRAAQCRIKHIGRGEKELADALIRRGIVCDPQRPCGVYNIDLAVGTVAVELVGLPWERKAKSRFPERFKYISNCGYTLICVQFRRIEQLLRQLDDIVGIIELTYRLPPSGRKHRMIRCGSNRFARSRDKRGNFTFIPTPEAFFYSVNEIYP